MPQPTGRDLHVDSLLTNLSQGHQNLAYIADRMAPIVLVRKQSDLIPVYDQSPWFRDEAKVRAPGTESEGGGWTVGNTSYYCMRYSFRTEISDEDRDNADSQWDLDADAVAFVTDKMQMRRERNMALSAFTTGIWNSDQTGGVNFTQWNDYATSDPAIDIADYMDAIESRIGREPNTLVIGKQVWNKLRFHPALIDSIKYTERGVLGEDLVASLLGVDRLLIGRSLYTADPEGTTESSVTYSRIWGKHALLLYVPDRPSLRTPASMYTFVWQRVPNAIQYIKRFRYDTREVDAIEANSYFDQRVVGARGGTFLSGAVA